MPGVIEKIKVFNKGRIPQFLQMKYAFMKQDVFRFYRGTCHLFYDDLSKKIKWKDHTKCWISGDLHLENFGTYKGDNRVVYFDMNDFDEALLAPATWEAARFLTSIFLAIKVLKIEEKMADELAETCINTYIHELQNGKALVVEKDTAHGLLKYFLETVRLRKENAFVLSKMNLKKKKLIFDKIKFFKIAETEKEKVIAKLNQWFQKNLPEKNFLALDIAHRVAGTGSLGISRYAVLVQEKRSKKFRLMDVKQAMPLSVKPFIKIAQPKWLNEATRVVTLQKRVQHTAPALLDVFVMDKISFVIKELQPTQDRMDLSLCKGKLQKLSDILVTMTQLMAWGQLRSAGRQSSSTADELIDFANKHKQWKNILFDYSKQYSKKVMQDYEEYCKNYEQLFVK